MSEALSSVARMPTITIEPATSDRLTDVEHAFDNGGDGRGCQCQWWTLTNAEWSNTSAEQRGELLAEEIAAGPPPGLVAYVDGEAAGWVRVSPRTVQKRIARTRLIVGATTEPLDDDTVWAVSCFVIRREHRGAGLSAALLDAAVEFARAHGARVIEAYPIDPHAGKKKSPNALYHGVVSTFQNAGFLEVARPQPDRPVVAITVA